MSTLKIPLTPHPLPQISFIATIKIKISPENVDEFFTHFNQVYERVKAEPEFVYFIMGRNEQVPGEIWWSEGWRHERGVEWFMSEQVTKEYYKPYFEATESMFLKPREVEVFTPVQDKCFFKMPAGK